MSYKEKIAYLKGLTEGSGIDEGTQNGKVIYAVISALEEMAKAVSALETDADDMKGVIGDIGETLMQMEELLFEDDDDDDDDEELYEAKCPECGTFIPVEPEMLDEGGVDCPECGEHLEFDFEDCDCGCEGCGNISHIHNEDND